MKPTIILSAALIVLALGAGLLFEKESTPSVEAAVWKPLEEAIQLASQQDKKILIDVYTDWCGWCKKMDAEVYTDERVKTVLNSRFIGVKLDAESAKRIVFDGSEMSQAEFASSAGVTGYPTTLFLDSNAKPITSVPGYVNAERFRAILAYIGEDHYRTTSFEEFLSRTSDR